MTAMKKIICNCSLFFFVFISSIGFAKEGFEGRIVTPDMQQPPKMIIKITPPRSQDTPQQITASDEDGRFQFIDLEKGKYLLEMYHDNVLIRREVIDTRETVEKEIRLVPER